MFPNRLVLIDHGRQAFRREFSAFSNGILQHLSSSPITTQSPS